MNKGIERELYYSRLYHEKGIPLLVSPLLLRRYGCGQLDLSILKENNQREKEIYLFEVKSSQKVGFRQMNRINKTSSFLSALLKLNSFFKIL